MEPMGTHNPVRNGGLNSKRVETLGDYIYIYNYIHEYIGQHADGSQGCFSPL